MDASQWISISGNLLFTAFGLYFIATVLFMLSLSYRKAQRANDTKDMKQVEEENQRRHLLAVKWGRYGFLTTVAGFISQSTYFVFRWIGQGHAPLSNMFEFMSFLSLTATLGFIIIYVIYRLHSLGVFVLPVVLTLLGWSAVFDTDPQPLVPSLQSYWLTLHVSTVAIAEGLFAVGFAAGLMYVIRTVDQKVSSRQTKALEFFLCTILMLIGFLLVTMVFSAANYEVSFEYINEQGQEQTLIYELPPIAGPYEGTQLSQDRMSPLISTPTMFQGVDAPRKFNTLLWSLLSGLVLYGLLRLALRNRLGAAMKPWLSELKPSMLDEISYRAIAIAFPIFTLGALIFAMIWAEQAWGRFWGWDPKEVWALITWLFYAAYLHLRLRRGWQGSKSAWLAVIGFIIIMFNLVFVNLIIAGLHSYAA